ncbi:MAG: redox-sensing transcriptional repressor Rex, partial [Gracilibacteraceae bacterium]|nr:redox-sensing transcriptional repressor Rex [Gracilibacteraceae bacterium]
MKLTKIPVATIMRMSVYLRYLDKLDHNNTETVSSSSIAKAVGASADQVRKDLAYFGCFGIRSVGYNIKALMHQIKKILNLDGKWRIAIVGAGNLGQALSMFQGFQTH